MKKRIVIEMDYDVGDEIYILYYGYVRRGLVRAVDISYNQKNKLPVVHYQLGIYRLGSKLNSIERVYKPNPEDNKNLLFSNKKDAVFKWMELNKITPNEMLQDFFQIQRE